LLDFLCELYYDARIHEHHAKQSFIFEYIVRNWGCAIPQSGDRHWGTESVQ